MWIYNHEDIKTSFLPPEEESDEENIQSSAELEDQAKTVKYSLALLMASKSALNLFIWKLVCDSSDIFEKKNIGNMRNNVPLTN